MPSPLDSVDASKIAADLEVSADGAFVNMATVDVAEYAKTHFEKP